MAGVVSFEHSGSFDNLEKYLRAQRGKDVRAAVEREAEAGVRALAEATPKDSGETAALWSYSIIQNGSGFRIVWKNSHVNKGVPIAVILQYGHGTGTGGYVQGRDYINPTMKPIFDRISENIRKAVTSS